MEVYVVSLRIIVMTNVEIIINVISNVKEEL